MKLEFLAFSDIHFGTPRQYATDTGVLSGSGCSDIKSVNTRLVDCLTICKQIKSYAKQNGIELILFGGDLTHEKKNVNKDTMNAIAMAFGYLSPSVWDQFVAINGNHDLVDKEGTNYSLFLFKNQICIGSADLSGSCYIAEEEYTPTIYVNGVHYTEDRELLKEKLSLPTMQYKTPEEKDYCDYDFRILLAHCGIQGAKIGSDYIQIKEYDLSSDDIPSDQYDICLFGHYHEHQKVFGNGWIIGATHEQVWSDRDGKRGFIHVILEKDSPKDKARITVKHIPTPREIPRFKLLDMESRLEDVKPWDFIRFQTEEEELTPEIEENYKGMLGSYFKAPVKWLEVLPKAKEKEDNTFQLSSKATDVSSVLPEWIEHTKPEFPVEKVIKVGHDLLAEAKRKRL